MFTKLKKTSKAASQRDIIHIFVKVQVCPWPLWSEHLRCLGKTKSGMHIYPIVIDLQIQANKMKDLFYHCIDNAASSYIYLHSHLGIDMRDDNPVLSYIKTLNHLCSIAMFQQYSDRIDGNI